MYRSSPRACGTSTGRCVSRTPTATSRTCGAAGPRPCCVDRGEARADVPIDLVLDALAGGVFFRVALAVDELAEGVVDDLVEFTLRGVTAT